MPKRVLFVSQYASPELLGGNNNVYRQAGALKHSLGVDVAILTWPLDDGWTGPSAPEADTADMFSLLEWSHEGIPYYITRLHKKYLQRVLTESDWQEAVELGCEVLRRIRPSIVHLQHWRGLWWLLQSAQKLSIPSFYSPHDWGMCCLRTILVTGEGVLCDGTANVDKCSTCILRGRKWLGKANETLVSTSIGERLIRRTAAIPPLDRWLTRKGVERIGLRHRVRLNHNRAVSILSNLHGLIVPNDFARTFYQQFQVPESRIHVLPWYYDLSPSRPTTREPGKTLSLGYIGRISEDKGVRRIFEALLDAGITNPIHLVIAGAISGEYATRLFSKYTDHVGKHSVEWMGWIAHREIHRFYQKVDAVLIPSEWIENGPLTLIESAAFKRPVIITDIPTIRSIVQEGHTGYLARFGSTESLSNAIKRASEYPETLIEMGRNMPPVASSIAYASALERIYETVADKMRWSDEQNKMVHGT